MNSAKLQEIAVLLDENQAEDLKILDVRKVTWITDYFVIAGGNSPVHTRALAEKLLEKTDRPLSMEGLESGKWILLDYGEIIVHIFLRETREFYRLEKLWQDAEAVTLPG